VVLGLSLAGCSTVPSTKTVVREDVAGHRLLVQLESLHDGPTDRFAHPVVGEVQHLAERIDPLLAELAYGRPRGKKLVRLLEVEDRQRLAAGLARGLTSAGPSERVVFLLRIDDGDQVPWFTPDDRLTRGIAFVDLEGRFNVAFDLVDDRVDPKDPDPYDPTERAQTRTRVVSETGEDIGAATDGPRRLWVAWKLLAETATEATLTRPAEPPSADAGKLELLDELLRDGVIDHDEYERRRTRLGPAGPAGASPR